MATWDREVGSSAAFRSALDLPIRSSPGVHGDGLLQFLLLLLQFLLPPVPALLLLTPRKMGDAAANLEAAMLNSLRSMRQNATGSFVDDVMGFYHAIDWSERWLLALLFFHLCVWLVVVGTRRHNTVQMVLLVALLAVVRAAEWINGVAGRHWELFASQQYFDKHGVFVSVMLSVNLLLAAFFILGNALRASVAMLIEVKKKEFKHEAKRKAKAAAGGAAGGGGEAKKTR